jgi:hypothetical protein
MKSTDTAIGNLFSAYHPNSFHDHPEIRIANSYLSLLSEGLW